MSDVQHGANTITIAGMTLLLTGTWSGRATHLTREHDGPGVGEPAVEDVYFDEHPGAADTLDSYDRDALTEPRWSETTVCGHYWTIMIGGDAGPVLHDDIVAWAPSCRRCIANMRRHLTPPEPDERIPVVSGIAADLVLKHGYADIVDVPGDQQDLLRRSIRKRLREAGHRCQTMVRETTVTAVCDDIYEQYADIYDKQVAHIAPWWRNEGVEPLKLDLPDCTVSWSAWEVG